MKYTRFRKRLRQLGGIGDNLGAWSGANGSLLLAEVDGVIWPLPRSASLGPKKGVSQYDGRGTLPVASCPRSLVTRSSTIDPLLEVLECVLCLADG